MDYYSGGNGESSFSNLDDNYSQPVGFSNMFRDNSNIILIIMAMAIVALIAGYLVYGINHESKSKGPDTNSTLSSLYVTGGELDPSFDPKVTKYTVYFDGSGAYVTGNSNTVSFSCEAASSKSKIIDCDKIIDMSGERSVEHSITVRAEDTSVTRYHFTIVRR
ncbi:MAG: hypothetical protein IKQ35_01600 [Bacilli bacterium]|nr:hypothetical protein [Bacilli bacterium]